MKGVRGRLTVCYFCGQPGFNYGSIGARTLELLAEDGGWWLITELADRLDVARGSVEQAVRRARHHLEVRRRAGTNANEYRSPDWRWVWEGS